MKILSIDDIRDSVIDSHKTGTQRGEATGFKCLDELLSFKKGYSTFFLGFPAAGKTELHLEMLFNLTKKRGWKHALLSAEIGTVTNVVAELCSKYLRKDFYKDSYNPPTEKELHFAMDYLSQYFFPIDGDANDFNIDTFYEYCEQLEKEKGIKLDTTSIDPWNDLNENLDKFANREDKYLAHALKKVRQYAKVKNWHNIIVTHAKETDVKSLMLPDEAGNKVACMPIPTLNSFAGGQVWGRRAFNVVGVWRPAQHELGIINPLNGKPFEKNEAVVKVLKAKPKGSAKQGLCYLFFDYKTNRYYEKGFGGIEKLYAFEHEKPASQPAKPENILRPLKPSEKEITADDLPY